MSQFGLQVSINPFKPSEFAILPIDGNTQLLPGGWYVMSDEERMFFVDVILKSLREGGPDSVDDVTDWLYHAGNLHMRHWFNGQIARDPVTHQIYTVLAEYAQKGLYPDQINNGFSEQFAQDVLARVVSRHKAAKLHSAEFMIEDDISGYADFELIDKKWNGLSMTERQRHQLERRIIDGHHWIYWNGRHYDAAAPLGVADFWTLPFFVNNELDVPHRPGPVMPLLYMRKTPIEGDDAGEDDNDGYEISWVVALPLIQDYRDYDSRWMRNPTLSGDMGAGHVVFTPDVDILHRADTYVFTGANTDAVKLQAMAKVAELIQNQL